MTASRYINGQFIRASPDLPAIIELGDDINPGLDMTEIDEKGTPSGSGLKPHFVTRAGGTSQGEVVMKPFDATVKRASGYNDNIEYQKDGSPASDGNQPVLSVERSPDAPKQAAPAATEAEKTEAPADRNKHQRDRAADKKVF